MVTLLLLAKIQCRNQNRWCPSAYAIIPLHSSIVLDERLIGDLVGVRAGSMQEACECCSNLQSIGPNNARNMYVWFRRLTIRIEVAPSKRMTERFKLEESPLSERCVAETIDRTLGLR